MRVGLVAALAAAGRVSVLEREATYAPGGRTATVAAATLADWRARPRRSGCVASRVGDAHGELGNTDEVFVEHCGAPTATNGTAVAVCVPTVYGDYLATARASDGLPPSTTTGPSARPASPTAIFDGAADLCPGASRASLIYDGAGRTARTAAARVATAAELAGRGAAPSPGPATTHSTSAPRTRPRRRASPGDAEATATEILVAAPEADFAADSDAEDGAEETINGDFGPQKGIANMAAFDAEIMRDFLVDVDKIFYDFASHRAEDVPDTSIRTVADAYFVRYLGMMRERQTALTSSRATSHGQVGAGDRGSARLHRAQIRGAESGYRVSGGLHGVGLSVVNALSHQLDVEVTRDGPDGDIFEKTVFDYDVLAARMDELAFLNAGWNSPRTSGTEKKKKKKGDGGPPPLGLGVRGEEFNRDNLRYHRIVIMTDADRRRAHIRAILTLFYRYQRSLIEDGHVFIACPPSTRFTRDAALRGSADLDDADRAAWRARFRGEFGGDGYAVERPRGRRLASASGASRGGAPFLRFGDDSDATLRFAPGRFAATTPAVARDGAPLERAELAPGRPADVTEPPVSVVDASSPTTTLARRAHAALGGPRPDRRRCGAGAAASGSVSGRSGASGAGARPAARAAAAAAAPRARGADDTATMGSLAPWYLPRALFRASVGSRPPTGRLPPRATRAATTTLAPSVSPSSLLWLGSTSVTWRLRLRARAISRVAATEDRRWACATGATAAPPAARARRSGVSTETTASTRRNWRDPVIDGSEMRRSRWRSSSTEQSASSMLNAAGREQRFAA
ncbi:hypothetical protein JL722_5767 [Aureococcus anophagefferens]|nr:hypothetical protein JL722_5767 [Aureococcus anophagefferens]